MAFALRRRSSRWPLSRWLSAGIGALSLCFSVVPVARAATPPAIPVQIGHVVAATASHREIFVGSLVAPRRAPLSPRLDGLIEGLSVEAGDTVSAGDELARLDSALAKISVASARAALAEAEARRSDARRRLSEAERLRERGHIPETTYETARADLAVQAAVVQRRRSELARETELLARHALVAPFGGVIVQRNVEVGQWVRSDAAAFELVALDPLRLEVPVPQRLYAAVAVGQSVELRFDADPERSHAGRVSARLPSAQTSARTFPVWVDVPNPRGDLAPGMSARAGLAVAQAASGSAVPSDALVRRPGGDVLVWRVQDAGDGLVAMPVPVTPGRVQGELTEVVADLAIGDRVVVRGNESLRPRQPVRIADAG